MTEADLVPLLDDAGVAHRLMWRIPVLTRPHDNKVIGYDTYTYCRQHFTHARQRDAEYVTCLACIASKGALYP